jgi:fatty acid-binding protein DegV
MVAHANGYENAVLIQEAINIIHPGQEIEICELSPVISVHTGPNTVGVAWVK